MSALINFFYLTIMYHHELIPIAQFFIVN